jgi:hypothetical protein
MYVPPEMMPGDSRIWIYQSSRKFTPEEITAINNLASAFVTNWTAHDNALRASYEILYDAFFVLMIDEKHASASGCSIDKSLHLVKQIEQECSLSLLDRMRVAFRDKEEIRFANRSEFEKLIGEGSITGETIVFNNLVNHKSELFAGWEVPLNQSWHKSLLAVVK